MRACAMLPALTAISASRGGLFVLERQPGQRGMDEAYLSGAHLADARGNGSQPDASPGAVSHMDLADILEDRQRSRALFVWNMNPLSSCPIRRGCEVRCNGRFIDRGGGPVSHRFHRLAIMCCRRRASWSSTTSSRRISI